MTLQRRAAKPWVLLSISASVHPGGITELSWTHAGRRYHGYSNVDFQHLAGIGYLDTESAVYSINFGLGRVWPDEAEALWLAPAELGLSAQYADYAVDHIEGGKPDEAAFAGLDALHAFYQLNRRQLAGDFAVREAAERLRREQLAKEPAAKPQDVEIRLWPVRTRPLTR